MKKHHAVVANTTAEEMLDLVGKLQGGFNLMRSPNQVINDARKNLLDKKAKKDSEDPVPVVKY